MTGALPANPFPVTAWGCRYSASRVFPMGLERLGQGAPRLCRGVLAPVLRARAE